MQNPYQNYKQQSINTMTQGEMLILLYDELLKRLTRADFALDNEDYTIFDQSVQRSKEIVKYLKDTLDLSYDISAELARMYNFFEYTLTRIHAGRNKELIGELKPLIKDLRDTFNEANRTARMRWRW